MHIDPSYRHFMLSDIYFCLPAKGWAISHWIYCRKLRKALDTSWSATSWCDRKETMVVNRDPDCESTVHKTLLKNQKRYPTLPEPGGQRHSACDQCSSGHLESPPTTFNNDTRIIAGNTDRHASWVHVPGRTPSQRQTQKRRWMKWRQEGKWVSRKEASDRRTAQHAQGIYTVKMGSVNRKYLIDTDENTLADFGRQTMPRPMAIHRL